MDKRLFCFAGKKKKDKQQRKRNTPSPDVPGSRAGAARPSKN
jgi:hypothetical protein